MTAGLTPPPPAPPPTRTTAPEAPDVLAAVLPRLREAGAHTLVYGIGSALQAASGFILIPLYTRHFDAATYGVFALLTLVSTFGATAFSFGAPSALARSYFDYTEPADRKGVVATSIYLVLAGGLLAMGITIAASEAISQRIIGSPAYGPHLRLILAMAILAQVGGVLLVLARFKRRSILVVGTNLVALVGTSVLIWYLLTSWQLGLMAPIIGMLVSQGVQVLWLGWALRDDIGVRGMRREVPVQLAYGLPAAAVGVLYYALDSVDRVLLNKLTDTSAVGVYSLGYRIAFVINVLLVQPFGQIWTPMRMEYRHDAHARRLFAVVLRYFLLAGLVGSLLIGTFSGELVALVAGGAQYREAYRVVGLVMLGYVAYGALGIVDAGIIFERKVHFHLVNFAVALALNVALNFLLIPRLGIVGAGLATLLTYAVVTIVAGALSVRLYRVPWELGRITMCVLLAVGALLAAAFLPIGTPVGVAIKVGLLAVVLPLLWFAGTEPAERAVAASVTRVAAAWLARPFTRQPLPEP
ncbi:MAG: oligosaccharide flippase family protein [Gemmatimonadaceae bacterium]|nr:oligosaccharide flippase family protein [Gemmatimonadaceae bacterium]